MLNCFYARHFFFYKSNLFEGTLNWGQIVIFVRLCHAIVRLIIFWLKLFPYNRKI